MYGFKERRDAEALKKLARQRHENVAPVMSDPDFTRVYLISPKTIITPASGELNNMILGLGQAYIYHRDHYDHSTASIVQHKYQNSGDPVIADVYNHTSQEFSPGQMLLALEDAWGDLHIASSGGSAEVIFAYYNGDGQFAPMNNSSTDVETYDTDTYITGVNMAPYLSMGQLSVGGIYRLERVKGCWYVTDGQCKEYVSPYVPIRMLEIEAEPDTNISSTFNDADVRDDSNAVVVSEVIEDGGIFATKPTFRVVNGKIGFTGAFLLSHADGIEAYRVYAEDSNGVCLGMYRLSIKAKATNRPPTLQMLRQTIDATYEDGTQTINIATITDADGDECSLAEASWSVISGKDPLEDRKLDVVNNVVKLQFTPKEEVRGTIQAFFKITDGYTVETGNVHLPTGSFIIDVTVPNYKPTIDMKNASASTCYGAEEQSVQVAKVSDRDGDTLTLTDISWSGSVSALESKSLGIRNGYVYADFKPLSEGNNESEVVVSFKVTDGKTPNDKLPSGQFSITVQTQGE